MANRESSNNYHRDDAAVQGATFCAALACCSALFPTPKPKYASISAQERHSHAAEHHAVTDHHAHRHSAVTQHGHGHCALAQHAHHAAVVKPMLWPFCCVGACFSGVLVTLMSKECCPQWAKKEETNSSNSKQMSVTEPELEVVGQQESGRSQQVANHERMRQEAVEVRAGNLPMPASPTFTLYLDCESAAEGQ